VEAFNKQIIQRIIEELREAELAAQQNAMVDREANTNRMAQGC